MKKDADKTSAGLFEVIKMKESITTLAIIALLVSAQPVGAESISAIAVAAQTLRGNIAWPEPPACDSDARFVAQNSQNTITQAKLSEIAARKGKSKEVREFASRMLEQSNMDTGFLQTFADAKDVDMSVTLDPAHQWRVTRISKLPKDIFNVAYLAQLNEDQLEELGALDSAPQILDPTLKAWAEQRKATLAHAIVAAGWVGVRRHADRVHVASNHPHTNM